MASLVIGICLSIFSHSVAQESPFVPQQVAEHLNNELSGEIAIHYMKDLAAIQRVSNSDGYLKAFQYLENKAREIGLFNIKRIEQPASRYEWDVRKAELWMLSPATRKLANFHAINTSLAVFSRSTHEMAELVDVGAGIHDSDYTGKEVAQKIVLASGALDVVMRKAVWEHGALGVIWYAKDAANTAKEKTYSHWQKIPLGDGNGKTGTFAFIISAAAANELQQILHSKSERPTFGRNKSEHRATSILLRIDIDATVQDNGKSWQVMADIPGEEILSEDIVLTAILPDNALPPFQDFSGAAGLLEIARTLTRLINDGLLPVPQRSIRFWWTSGSQCISQYFIDRPEAKDSILANIHLGEIGAAKQFGDGFILAHSPPSNTSYWTDIVTSIANDYYHIETPSYFFHPVQQIFTQSAISIPSLVITSKRPANFAMPDQIFSQLDPAQFKQNAFLATAATWYLARFRDKKIPALVSMVYSNGRERQARTLQAAFRLVGKDRFKGYALAELVIEETKTREQEALRSISILATGSQALDAIDDFSRRLRDDEKTAKNRLKLFYSSLYERRPPKTGRLNGYEKLALRTIPRNNPELAAYLNRRQNSGDELQSVLANEIINYVNGQRNVYEIYRAVLAEAILSGFWPYETITLKKVRAVLDAGVKMGMLAY